MSYPVAITHNQAIQIINELASKRSLSHEVVRVPIAAGRFLYEDLLAPHDVPANDCSRMDGYAINTNRIKRAAGSSCSGYVVPLGEPIHAAALENTISCGDKAIPVMTGAVMPTDADAIVIKEQSEVNHNQLHFEQLPDKFRYFRTKGSDLRKHQVVIKAHQLLTAAHLGLISSLGITAVQVMQQPRVALMMNGDELVPPGQALHVGQIYDANSSMLSDLLQSMGCEVELLRLIGDDKQDLSKRLEQIKHMSFDLIISVGGVSMGDKDWIPSLLGELGEVAFHKVLVKPGFPLLCGQLGSSLFFGLPGNPVSAYTAVCQYVLSAIKQITQQPIEPPVWTAHIVHDWRKSHSRREYLRAFYDVDAAGQIQVKVCGEQQSSRIESLAEANCFLLLDEMAQNLTEGDAVMIQPFFLLHSS
ncbi:molybdopterin molybdotransferase MoeA [Marinicella sp. S1101]|uniref:molybdopterin molybdotransferase MoeA n=1 Tax=Marinicella marina TaxID=2996016 RepID=UPI002260A9C6|nr:molybdopterin molybdotransferase MoeA [Marinicella marina]MCX7553619.1 molybdopterin molybdotransferase MoeA [Marinicella marina]MDJ1140243.1 molybdopterin molybdotransferase MoeA [Marinicella marina]